MFKIIEAVFSLISLVILATAWIFMASVISYCIKKSLKIHGRSINMVIYSISIGIILEIMLSAVSLIAMPSLSRYNNAVDAGVLSGLEKGSNIAVLLTPISSVVGSIIGFKKNSPPWKGF